MKLAKKNQHFDFPNNMHWQPLHTPLIYKNTTMYIVVWCAFQYILYTILAPLFLHPEDRSQKSLNEVLIIIVILLVGMIIHEFVHILFIPGSIFSQKIYITVVMMMGCIPSMGFFYTGILTRKRQQIMLMMPFLIISVIPGSIIYFSHISNWYLFILIYLNACGCINDFINTFNLFRYPANSQIFMGNWSKGTN